ncbi:hypothetical protein E3U23_11270 [Erythrobacter litoralis]|uniref:hypothetical protein n=1 Tax=Erythrobacter litoralis TaxID=39960 RepID=UPI002434899C|nr:hypothetical protein [Erythrobacter litoralis]MDG6079769.1 hypothetical protein [Erythrobacter litoralis]
MTRRATALEKDRAERHAKIAGDYRARHPERAKQEREFRKEQAERGKAHAKRDRLIDGGTPETKAKAAQVKQGSLARLYEAGHITIEQLVASQEIRTVVEQIGADVAIGTVSFETRVDDSRRGQGTFFERLGAVRAEVAYGRWRAAQGTAAAPVLAMIALDQSVTAVAKAHGMRKETVRGLLSKALDAWSEFVGQACREIDEADVLAAHAGLI